MSRHLVHTKNDADRNFQDIYKLLTEAFKKLDGFEYGLDGTTGKGFLKIETSDGAYKSSTDNFRPDGNMPQGGLDDSIPSADVNASTITSFNKSTGQDYHDALPSEYGIWKWDFVIQTGDNSGNLVTIPADFVLERIVLIVTVAFDNNATIKFSDTGSTLMWDTDSDLTDTSNPVEQPVWKSYSAENTLSYTVTGAPTVGYMRVIVKGLKLTK